MDITENLDPYLKDMFPNRNVSHVDGWISQFQNLLKGMLDISPNNRPNASEVWTLLKVMVESLGTIPHCNDVSPVGSVPDVEVEADGTEIQVRVNGINMITE